MGSVKLGVLLGPTASGKTDISLRLARRLDAEIVSADSMLVYRGMDIGTAKPTLQQRQEVFHHVIDVVEPHEHYDAARYRRDAMDAAGNIVRRGKRILVVGGTGLYIRALIWGLFPGPAADHALRRGLEGCETLTLYGMLKKTDPASAARIHHNDRMRIIRALEVHRLTGNPLSFFHRGHGFAKPLVSALCVGLKIERETLHNRIDARTKGMFSSGLVEEVERLLAMGYGPELPPMQAFAYRHACDVVRGRISREEATRRIARDTWRLAKRQMIWFRKEKDIVWIPYSAEEEAACLFEAFFESEKMIPAMKSMSAC